MITKKKELSIDELKKIGIADFYGNIDGGKFRNFAENQASNGYEVTIKFDVKGIHNILDNEPVTYDSEVIQQDVQIINEDVAADK